ncbi:outer membrane protein, related to OmpA/MotB [Desulfosarcina variabilis str. Montpellier]|uniref:ExeA family protein n=1 Tax=Desulfosarcina variabilis TaxID=2300 RepID=UPI003AFA44AC
MYESHYGLNKKPFQITTDPTFLWMGEKHREALTTLKYGVMDNKGFLLLTGDVGTGKTTLINRLIEDFKDKVYTAKIPDPRLTKYDFYRMVSRYFKLPIEVRTKSDFIDPFTRFLSDAQQEKKSVLLLIDEAQRLKQDLMEEIRLLSKLEYQDTKLLNIFFVGQNEFSNILLQPENRALMRRITITYNIEPLDQTETGDYIRHRLKVAGAGYDIFSAGAVEEIYDFSNGFPRQINIICDLAMFFASQFEQRTISRKVVQQCRERISFDTIKRPEKPQQPIYPAAKGPLPAPSKSAGKRSPLTKLWVGIGVALLVACTAGMYFTAPEWKARARKWIEQISHSDETPSRALTQPSQGGSDTTGLSAGTAASSAVDDWTVPSTDELDRPLRMPHRPPAIDAAPLRPDPADAVEWVLKKRQQEKNS